MVRIAAVGDVHYDRNPRPMMRSYFEDLHGRADLLLIAGDLTQTGDVEEARALAADLRAVRIPVVSVLGNHDYHRDRERDLADALREAGVVVLEGESATFALASCRIGVVGIKGFGGGFGGACCTDFGEPETRAFARHARLQADILRDALLKLDADYKFALTHYAPIEGTLLGERREIYPFLGSYLLGQALDEGGVDGAFHGHAHMGTERGSTPGGIPVRNVAQMVIRHAYNIYTFEKGPLL